MGEENVALWWKMYMKPLLESKSPGELSPVAHLNISMYTEHTGISC